MSYCFARTVPLTFDEAVERVTAELAKEGFGVLTQIDVKETLKKKLNADFRPYKILGACNPPFAHQALLAEDRLGLMLPCNVIVQETTDGRIEVAAIDPAAQMAKIDNPNLHAIGEQVREKLRLVIDRV